MKTYTLVIDERAVGEILTAIEYYSEIYGDLAIRFETALGKAIDQIMQNPFYQIKYDSIRCLLIKKFPYSIHYSIDEKYDEIHILAIVHTASDPDKQWMWQEE